jgi:hypothetical protein
MPAADSTLTMGRKIALIASMAAWYRGLSPA